MELPQYSLRPQVNRMLVPWILKLLGLSVVFYFCVVFFIKTVLSKSIPPAINLFIFAFLVVLVVFQIIIYHIKYTKYRYVFYTDRIEFEGKKKQTWMFSEVQTPVIEQNFFDKMFKTGSIRLNQKFALGPVQNPDQVKEYTEKLAEYNARVKTWQMNQYAAKS